MAANLNMKVLCIHSSVGGAYNGAQWFACSLRKIVAHFKHTSVAYHHLKKSITSLITIPSPVCTCIYTVVLIMLSFTDEGNHGQLSSHQLDLAK